MSPTEIYSPAGVLPYRPEALPVLEYQPRYITTDESSNYQLIKGKHYFMDFDVSQAPLAERQYTRLEDLKNDFIRKMREQGHDFTNVTAMSPRRGVVRFYFIANPLPLIITIAIAVGILMVAYGVVCMFIGLGEGGPLPVLFQKGLENPWAVVAIVAAVGLFILGVGIK